MFQAILDELVQRTGARAAAFCDYEGEAVAISPRGDRDGEYDIKVAGATMCAAVMGMLERTGEVGAPRWAAVRTDSTAVLLALLKDGYYVLLLLRAGNGEGRARRHLAEAAARILADM